MSTNPLDHKLTQLKLGRIREVVDQWIRHAEQHQLGYGEFLEELPGEEVLTRQENQIRRKLKAAGFPFAATLEQFDFSLRPELKRAVMVRFFDRAFIEKAGCLILIGPSGLGKTHLVVALGAKMVQLGYSVRFLTAQQFANQVLAASTRVDVGSRSRVSRLAAPAHVRPVDPRRVRLPARGFPLAGIRASARPCTSWLAAATPNARPRSPATRA